MKTIAEIEAMLAAITPGQWTVRDSPLDDGSFFVEAPKAKPTDPYNIEILGEDTTLYLSKRGDAEFIAAAPEIVRDLLRLAKFVDSTGQERPLEVENLFAVAERAVRSLCEGYSSGVFPGSVISIADSLSMAIGEPIFQERVKLATERNKR